MDALNLAIVICPNLVRSANAIRDVMMCSVPVPTTITGMNTLSGGSLSSSFTQDSGSTSNGTTEGKATLGIVIALCIRRYYEVFDEVVDRSEAVAPWRALRMQGAVPDGASDGSGSSQQPTYVLGDDDDLDDDGMPSSFNGHQQEHRANAPASSSTMIPGRQTKRHRNTLSNGSNGPSATARSMFNSNEGPSVGSPSAWHNTNGGGHSTIRSSAPGHPTHGKTKSLISIERSGSAVFGGTMRKGSISIGRGTTRKGSGAAVEAVGVVAEGFFTPPSGAPPVPKLVASPRSSISRSGAEGEGDQEEPTLSVGERRKLFENGGP